MRMYMMVVSIQSMSCEHLKPTVIEHMLLDFLHTTFLTESLTTGTVPPQRQF